MFTLLLETAQQSMLRPYRGWVTAGKFHNGTSRLESELV